MSMTLRGLQSSSFAGKVDELFFVLSIPEKTDDPNSSQSLRLDFWQKDCGATVDRTHGGV